MRCDWQKLDDALESHGITESWSSRLNFRKMWIREIASSWSCSHETEINLASQPTAAKRGNKILAVSKVWPFSSKDYSCHRLRRIILADRNGKLGIVPLVNPEQAFHFKPVKSSPKWNFRPSSSQLFASIHCSQRALCWLVISDSLALDSSGLTVRSKCRQEQRFPADQHFYGNSSKSLNHR